MADSAALKLGSLISGQISGALSGFTSGMKGSFISANPAVLGPMVGALSKGFSSINSQSQKDARRQREENQRAQGFAEESRNEQKKYEQILLAVQKGMAINVEQIQKDVRSILETLKKDNMWDKLKDMFAGIAAGVSAFIDEILKALKLFVDKIGSFIDDFIKFFQSIPGRISAVIDDIVRLLENIPKLLGNFFDFLKNLPNKFGSLFNDLVKLLSEIPSKIGNFFSKLFELFGDITKKYFPSTRSAIAKFFSDLADILKLDKIKGFFTSQLENLKNLFKFDDLFKTIGNKFENLVKLLGESDIAKAFRRIRNIFAISFAQYADELEDLFNNKILASLGKIRTSISNLGEKIPTAIEGLVDAFKTSKLGSLADDLYTRISSGFESIGTTFKESKVGLLTDDITNIFKGLFNDFKSLVKFPSFSELETMFDLGRNVKTLDEFKYLLGETGILGKIFTTIGTVTETLNVAGVKVFEFFGHLKDIFSGPLKVISELSGLTDLGRLIGTVTPFFKFLAGPLAIVFTLIDGIMGAADTKALQETFGTKDVTWKERIAGFFGGVVSGIFGLFDLIADFFGYSTKDESGKTLQERVFSATSKLTKGVMDAAGKLIDMIVGIFTFDVNKIKDAGTDLFGMIKNSFAVLGNIMIDSVNWLIDKLPEWLQDRVGKLDRIQIAGEGQKNPYLDESRTRDIYKTPSAPPVSAEAQRLMNVPGAYRGASVATTEQDLVAMGLRIKPGKTQVAGRGLSPLTVRGAEWLQKESGFPIDRFTGFNDGHPREKSSQDPHSKGLAFDFTIPQNLATDDNFRKSLAKAISSATGAYVVDEYAIRTPNWTGGHFHVDFSRASGVDLGTGVYAGFNWKDVDDVNPTDIRLSRIPAPVSTPPSMPDTDIDASTSFSGQTSSVDFSPVEIGASNGEWDVLPPLTKTAKATQASAQLQRQQLEEQRKQNSYVQRREALFEEFNNNMKNIFRPMVNSLMGPGMDNRNKSMAGTRLSESLRKDFEKVGVQIFGKQYGPAMGQTFQKLAGVYMDQFIDQTLAPMLGMNSDILNRSINTYLEGKSKYGQAIKDANKALATAKSTLSEAEKKSGFSLAEIIKTAGTFKGFSPEQLSRISQLTGLRQNVSKAEENLAKQKALRNQYNMAALEDLIFGSTGFSIGPRTMIEQYGGPEKLIQDLATLFGAPFKPAFGLDEKDNKKLQAESSLYKEHVQGQQQVFQGHLQSQQQVFQGHLQGQQQLNSQFISAFAQVTQDGAVAMQRAYSTAAMDRAGGSADLVDAVSLGVQDGMALGLPTYSGTSIPGLASGGGIGGGARGGGGLADFGLNLFGNMLGGKVAQKIGITNPVVGKLFTQFGSNLLTGKDAFGNLQGSLDKLGSGGFGNGLMALAGLKNANVNSLGGALSTALNAYQAYGFLKSSSLGNMFSQGVSYLGSGIQSLGNFIGSPTLSGFGGGFAGTTMAMPSTAAEAAFLEANGVTLASGSQGAAATAGTSASSMLSSAGTVALAAYGGRLIGKGISGGYSALGGKSGNAAVNLGTAAGAFFGPVGALIGGAIGGTVNRLFGSKTGATGVNNLSGVLGGDGDASVSASREMRKKYGKLRFKSDKVWNEAVAVDPEVLKAFTETTKEIKTGVGDLLQPFGQLSADITKVQTSFNLRFTGGESEEQKLKLIQAEFERYRDTLIDAGNPFIQTYKKTSETLVEATARLGNALATSKQILGAFGFIGEGGLLNFLGFNAQTSGLDIKTLVANKLSELQEAFGGLDKFQNVFANLLGKMFTPEEQAQINLVRLNEEFKEYADKFAKSGSTGGVTLPAEIPEDMETARKVAKEKFLEINKKYGKGEITAKAASDAYAAINAYLLATEQKVSMKSNQPTTGAPDSVAFDPSKYIPIVNELGDVVYATPTSTVTAAATNAMITDKTSLEDAYTFVNEFTGVHPRASGGSIRGNRPYIVGEVGPEIFIPNAVGTIVPTHDIIEAIQDASSLDTKTRNLLAAASPYENSISKILLDQQNENESLINKQKYNEKSINSAIIDNSVTSISSPSTNIVNLGDNVRSTHPVAGVFTRAITSARL